jgi:mannose-6-phosphate isomerase
MVLEIQQSSDVTYRVYDYQRLDEQRHLRPLHLDQAFAVTTIPHLSPQRKKLNRLLLNQLQTLVDNPHYRIDALGLSEKQSFNLSNPHYQLGFVLEGFFIFDNEMFKKGDYLILTSLQKNILTLGQGWLILATPQ